MHKKLLLFMLMLLSISAEAEVIDGVNYYLDNSVHHAVVISKGLMDPYKGYIDIPISFSYKDETYMVTAIGNSAFSNCKELECVALSSSINTIGHSAFSGCSSLKTVSLMGGVVTIQSSAFRDCSSLTYITLPTGLKYIGNYAFSGCSSMTYFSFNGSTPELGIGVFENCTGLTSIDLPNYTYKIIPKYLFNGCKGLTSIILPEGITKIDNCAFQSCSDLKTVILPNSLDSICQAAFNRTAIEYLYIPVRVKYIGDYAFYSCERLKKIVAYPFSPPEIKDATFKDFDLPLFVPKSHLEVYKKAPIWSAFFDIKNDNTDPGDANGDGSVNESDIDAVMDLLLGKTSGDFNKVAADMNGDGKVNVADIVKIVNLINSSQ